MARPEDMRKAFKRNMNRLRLSDSLDLIKYTFALLLVLVGVVAVVAFVFGKPAKTKQVAVQPTRVVKQVVYRAPKPLTPEEQTAEVENIFATVITDKTATCLVFVGLPKAKATMIATKIKKIIDNAV
jgi:hypothetical protein